MWALEVQNVVPKKTCLPKTFPPRPTTTRRPETSYFMCWFDQVSKSRLSSIKSSRRIEIDLEIFTPGYVIDSEALSPPEQTQGLQEKIKLSRRKEGHLREVALICHFSDRPRLFTAAPARCFIVY